MSFQSELEAQAARESVDLVLHAKLTLIWYFWYLAPYARLKKQENHKTSIVLEQCPRDLSPDMPHYHNSRYNDDSYISWLCFPTQKVSTPFFMEVKRAFWFVFYLLGEISLSFKILNKSWQYYITVSLNTPNSQHRKANPSFDQKKKKSAIHTFFYVISCFGGLSASRSSGLGKLVIIFPNLLRAFILNKAEKVTISSLGRHSPYKQHAKGYRRKSVVCNSNPDF